MAVHFDEARGRHIIKFSLTHNGKQVRKTKMLPAGLDLYQALQIERRMLRVYDPYIELKDRLAELNGSVDLGWIYACVAGNGPIKIGMTRKNVYARVRSFNTSSVEPWRLIGDVRVKFVADAERVIHSFLSQKRLAMNRELFDLSESEAMDLLGVVADELECIDARFEVGFRDAMALA